MSRDGLVDFGKVSFGYAHFLGYERGENKDDPPVVNQEQAATVRDIYRMFMEGKTGYMIAQTLTDNGIPTPAGKPIWCTSTVMSILQNEKYRGSAMLQKSFTTDFLTKKMKRNEGEVPKYYIEHGHEAIITPVEWDAVQEEIERRKSIGRAYSGVSVLGAKLICGDCGGWYGAKVWHSTDPYKTRIWQCNCKFRDGKPRCRTPHLREEDVKAKFLEAYNRMLTDKKRYIRACEIIRDTLADTSAIDAELDDLLREKEVVEELTKKLLQENAFSANEPDGFQAKYDAYVERHKKLEARCGELLSQRETRVKKAKSIERFTLALRKRKDVLTEFDNTLWLTTVDSATVHPDGQITFLFRSGTEITV